MHCKLRLLEQLLFCHEEFLFIDFKYKKANNVHLLKKSIQEQFNSVYENTVVASFCSDAILYEYY